MEELTPLLNELAAQLNTTVDFLWGVLLYQAKIQAIKSFIQLVLMLSFLSVTWRLTALVLDKFNETEKVVARTVSLLVFAALTLFVIGGNIDSMIDAYFNPEYWAFSKY